MPLPTAVHILGGIVGIISGYAALATAKGATAHRNSGMVFVYSMLTMALLGGALAAIDDRSPATNIPAAALTAYLVMSGLATVRPSVAGSRRLHVGLMLLVLSVALADITFGVQALASPTGKRFGMPFAPFFIFGGIALLAGLSDIRIVRSGALRGVPRLARHLWRMSTALLIAAFSLFLGQAKVFPKAMRIPSLLAIPPLIVLGAMIYWLWRVRGQRTYRRIVALSARVT